MGEDKIIQFVKLFSVFPCQGVDVYPFAPHTTKTLAVN